ncbi:hypothetical protein ACOSP7_006992 [Xanthoceras sorbifolium]
MEEPVAVLDVKERRDKASYGAWLRASNTPKAVGQQQSRENSGGSNLRQREGRWEKQPDIVVSDPLHMHGYVHHSVVHESRAEQTTVEDSDFVQPAGVEASCSLPHPSATVNKIKGNEVLQSEAGCLVGCAQQGLSSIKGIASGGSLKESNKSAGSDGRVEEVQNFSKGAKGWVVQ